MSLDMQSRVVRVDHVMAVPVNDELVMATVILFYAILALITDS